MVNGKRPRGCCTFVLHVAFNERGTAGLEGSMPRSPAARRWHRPGLPSTSPSRRRPWWKAMAAAVLSIHNWISLRA